MWFVNCLHSQFLGHLSHSDDLLLLVFVHRRATSVVRLQSYIYNFFLKTTRLLFTIYCFEDVCDYRTCMNLNLDSRGSGQIWKKTPQFSKIFFYTPTQVGNKTNCMIMMSIHLSTWIVKFMVSWSGVQALGVANLPYIKNVLNL